MKLAFEHHGGERWDAVACAEVKESDNAIQEAIRILRKEGSVALPLGVYRIRTVPNGLWRVGELRTDGTFILDDEELRSLS